MRCCSAILFFVLLISSSAAQDFSWPIKMGGSGSGTSGQDEFTYQRGFRQEGGNPNANQQKRLVVEWGRVSMGYVDADDSLANSDAGRWTWKDDESLRRDRMLSLRGKLLIESPDGKDRRPIDWVQGVRVIVSRLPDRKYDWSHRQEMHEAVWGDFTICERGEFLAAVSPGEVCRTVGKSERFQVALSLGEKKGTRVTWKNTVPVLPRSVTMLDIPGPPSIGKTMQIVNGAPSYDPNNFNPAKLVRAVNHLMPMGKKKAIHELREFLKIARDSSNETIRRDENIDTSDRTCVFLIVRLLFESADPTDKPPAILTVPFTPIPDDEDKILWPLYPVHIQDDIPFFLVYGGGLGGAPDQPERHIDWTEKQGRLRNKRLRPIDNPVLAATRLAALSQTERLYEGEPDYYKATPYRQAWNIIEDADPKLPKPIPPANTWDEPDWDARVKAAAKRDIHWSQGEQRYIVK
ncbi:hypothetical protein ACFL2H_09100 [Planctomycetota bacterium]